MDIQTLRERLSLQKLKEINPGYDLRYTDLNPGITIHPRPYNEEGLSPIEQVNFEYYGVI